MIPYIYIYIKAYKPTYKQVYIIFSLVSDVTSVLTRPITPLDRPKTPATLSNEEILKIIAENSALKNQVQKQEGIIY